MIGYKLIKEYPGSPKLGSCIYKSQSEIFQIRPESYPELWQEFETDQCITTDDNCFIKSGELIYCISDKRICTISMSEFFIKNENTKYFGNIDNAIDYLYSQIEVDTESGKVIGENIDLFGICLGNGTQYKTESSYNFWKRNVPFSNKWKWFKTEAERNLYQEFNECKYSKQDLILFGLFLEPDIDGIVIAANVNNWINGRTDNTK